MTLSLLRGRPVREQRCDTDPVAIKKWRIWLDRGLDSATAALVFALSLPPLLNLYNCDCPPAAAWGFALLTAQCLPLLGRRRWPVASALACGTATVVYTVVGLPEPTVSYAGLVAVYGVAAHASRRRAMFAAVVAVVAVTITLWLDSTPVDLDDALVTYLTFSTAWLLGNGVRDRSERTSELEQRAAALERTRTAEAERVVVEERNRIARELHDVVAHHVSLMVVQAEAGPVALQRDPASPRRSWFSPSRSVCRWTMRCFCSAGSPSTTDTPVTTIWPYRKGCAAPER